MHSLSVRQLILRVLLPFAAGYFLSYLYRTVNAVLAPEIARTIHLDAGVLGLMTGVYFLAFGSFQLPLGLLLDRFGPRRVEAALLVFAASGAAAFAWAEDAGTLVGGRALIGLGVSACLMAALKANVQFFPAARLPLMNGIILSAGGLGAVAATAPVQALLAVTDWRGVYAVLAGLTLAAAVALFLTVPDRPGPASGETLGAQLRAVGRVFADPLFLRVAPFTSLAMGTFMAVQGLWAGPWLRDIAGLDPQGVAAGLAVMAGAMAAGFLLVGAAAERLARLGIPAIQVGGAGTVVFLLAQAAMAAGWSDAPFVLAAVYGFSGATSTVMYAVVTQGFPPHLAGRANTSLNLVIFACAFATQWGLGEVIGLWPKGETGWPPEAYRIALALPAAALAAALVWFMPAARTARSAE
ncbi:nitrate/nitrite transporter [Magnetospirillum sp. UT-4]|uniref:MFS transporter n=1 Tax=Magnetospirillum sp. UT-4 TaxID=2681467 RepID=UPI0013863774|nr:MFS transporter [Magnetospirillum sp. UT-4]CAA7625385.1 Permease of the major facilitator superfamily [Magnetospirillum sp. UT-4]